MLLAHVAVIVVRPYIAVVVIFLLEGQLSALYGSSCPSKWTTASSVVFAMESGWRKEVIGGRERKRERTVSRREIVRASEPEAEAEASLPMFRDEMEEESPSGCLSPNSSFVAVRERVSRVPRDARVSSGETLSLDSDMMSRTY